MNPVQHLLSQVLLVVVGLMVLSVNKESRIARALVYLGVILLIITATFFAVIPVIIYSPDENVFVPLTYAAGDAAAFLVFLKAVNKINFKKMFLYLAFEALVVFLIVLILMLIL